MKICYIGTHGEPSKAAIKDIVVRQSDINRFKNDPSLLMGKVEYNKYFKEQQKEALNQKQHEYYERVNNIIDYANTNRDSLIMNGGQKQLDNLMLDKYNNIIANEELYEYINKLDDYEKFEIKKYL